MDEDQKWKIGGSVATGFFGMCAALFGILRKRGEKEDAKDDLSSLSAKLQERLTRIEESMDMYNEQSRRQGKRLSGIEDDMDGLRERMAVIDRRTTESTQREDEIAQAMPYLKSIHAQLTEFFTKHEIHKDGPTL